MRELVVASGGVRLAVRDSGGDRPALVLLHGAGDNLATWEGLGRLLTDEFRLVSHDARGHGLSETPAAAEADALLADLEAVLGLLELRRPVLVGHSFGGSTALRFAAAGRDVRCVCAIDAGPWRGAELPPFDADLIRARRYGWSGDDSALAEELAAFVAKAARESPGEPRELVEASFRRSHERGADGLWRRKPLLEHMTMLAPLLREPGSQLTVELFDRIDCPTLLVCATEGSSAVAEPLIAQISARRPNVTSAWIAGGHFVHWERPEEVAGHLRAFARALASG